jgi:hypothetical protein
MLIDQRANLATVWAILGLLGDLELEDEDETPCPINRRPISTCPNDCDHGYSKGEI